MVRVSWRSVGAAAQETDPFRFIHGHEITGVDSKCDTAQVCRIHSMTDEISFITPLKISRSVLDGDVIPAVSTDTMVMVAAKS
jgi:hypothetical protein